MSKHALGYIKFGIIFYFIIFKGHKIYANAQFRDRIKISFP